MRGVESGGRDRLLLVRWKTIRIAGFGSKGIDPHGDVLGGSLSRPSHNGTIAGVVQLAHIRSK